MTAPKKPQIVVNQEAYTAYRNYLEEANIGGWEKSTIASNALIHGIEILKAMDVYNKELATQAKLIYLDKLIEDNKGK